MFQTAYFKLHASNTLNVNLSISHNWLHVQGPNYFLQEFHFTVISKDWQDKLLPSKGISLSNKGVYT